MTTTPAPASPAADAAADDLIRRATARLAERCRLPESTYRLQFHKGFTFRDAAAVVPYLADLGVTHCYASPYLKARPGSTHGYDVIDHNALNPELGTRADYDAWVGAMWDHNMGHVLDTVPNHAGVGTNDNAWWNDVLEHGRASRYADNFDIAWDGASRPAQHGKVLLPTLGGLYGDVLERGELKLAFDLATGTFAVDYFDRRFPLDPRTYADVLDVRLPDLRKALGSGHAELVEYENLITAARDLSIEPSAAAGRAEAATTLKRRLADLVRRNAPAREHVEQVVRDLNGAAGGPACFDALDRLLAKQNYRLAYWRAAPDEINYRRFFDINDLAALAMEHKPVFDAAHELTFTLLTEGNLDGLRIDHPDGLFDPKQYLDRLQQLAVVNEIRAMIPGDPTLAGLKPEDLAAAVDRCLAAGPPAVGTGPLRFPLYVTVEKILAPDEPLPADWACHGTSGYDFLNVDSGLFVDPAGEAPLTRFYESFTGRGGSLPDLVYEKKKLILRISLASELRMLANRLGAIAERDRHARDFTQSGLTDALREVIACFPVYRSYVTAAGVGETDVKRIDQAVDEAVRRNPKIEAAVFKFIRDTLVLTTRHGDASTEQAARLAFAHKFQQLTAPATAKGIEDTAFYIYNRLISLNEVGGEPDHFGVSPAAAHAYLADRAAHWPYALSALSTHDTKRSEDVRARIHVLSELPDAWAERVRAWSTLNSRHKTDVSGRPAPDANEEYLLYQTLVGVWPHDQADAAGQDVLARVQAYLLKAMREAKVNTSWTDQNADHEKAVERFAAAVLDERGNAAFFVDFLPFQKRVAWLGIVNSLSQTLVRLAAPGVPDTYQGTELWDLSLVDPDNRRPVDYTRRRELLAGLASAGKDLAGLARSVLASPTDGRVKLHVVARALDARRSHPGLFSTGTYAPLAVTGSKSGHAFAFARVHGPAAALVVVPRLPSGLGMRDGSWPVGADVWGDTALVIPPELNGRSLCNLFTGATVTLRPGLKMAEVLDAFPVGLYLA
ncbi:MAG: malto-oligosyltrehalose synthase [Phycisphaerales bacterium]|nr:malto-oligosyltrehalose synthase [Phycisphaerales bacterium]